VTAPPPPPPPLLADEHLGRLARYLRATGLDVALLPGVDDDVLAAAAAAEGRLLLTRDRRLALGLPAGRGLLVRAGALADQLVEVLGALGGIDPLAAAFTRCLVCNERLEPIAKAAVAGRVPERTLARHDDYRLCRRCDRVYWAGSHLGRMEATLREVRQRLGSKP